MNDTPRTDRYEQHYIETGNAGKLISLAKKLERELTTVTEQRDELRKRIAQLEDLYAKACKNVEELAEIGLDQMDKERSTNKKLSDYKNQRDGLAMALQELCEALLTGNPRDITKLLNKAGDALQFTPNPNEL